MLAEITWSPHTSREGRGSLGPLTAFRRNPSSFHNDNPASTEDVKKDVLEKALTWKMSPI